MAEARGSQAGKGQSDVAIGGGGAKMVDGEGGRPGLRNLPESFVAGRMARASMPGHATRRPATAWTTCCYIRGTRFGGVAGAMPFLVELACDPETRERPLRIRLIAGLGARVESGLQTHPFDRVAIAAMGDDEFARVRNTSVTPGPAFSLRPPVQRNQSTIWWLARVLASLPAVSFRTWRRNSRYRET